jgi:hypothetical protein
MQTLCVWGGYLHLAHKTLDTETLDHLRCSSDQQFC